MEFTKMQGLGNDYVYVNCLRETIKNPAEVSKFVSDRHFGIGSDGLIMICPSKVADFEMQMGPEVKCAEMVSAVLLNMYMITVLPIRRAFPWRHLAGSNIWI